MGIILKPGMLGEVRGKVGNVVSVKWKDKIILRKAPVRRRSEPTKGETARWSEFATLHRWLKPLIPFLRAGFNGYPNAIHAYNAAKSLALKNAFVGTPRVIDPSRVQVSWGDLPLPSNISVSLSGEKELLFSWDPSGHENLQLDQAMLLAYDPAQNLVASMIPGQFRKDGANKLSLEKAGNYHVYIAFVSTDRSRQSASAYLGYVEVQ